MRSSQLKIAARTLYRLNIQTDGYISFQLLLDVSSKFGISYYDLLNEIRSYARTHNQKCPLFMNQDYWDVVLMCMDNSIWQAYHRLQITEEFIPLECKVISTGGTHPWVRVWVDFKKNVVYYQGHYHYSAEPKVIEFPEEFDKGMLQEVPKHIPKDLKGFIQYFADSSRSYRGDVEEEAKYALQDSYSAPKIGKLYDRLFNIDNKITPIDAALYYEANMGGYDQLIKLSDEDFWDDWKTFKHFTKQS